MSSVRRSAVGVGLKFGGRSVKGTSVSPCASAGVTQSGSASRLATLRLLLTASRRVIWSAMHFPSSRLRVFYLVGSQIATDLIADDRADSAVDSLDRSVPGRPLHNLLAQSTGCL